MCSFLQRTRLEHVHRFPLNERFCAVTRGARRNCIASTNMLWTYRFIFVDPSTYLFVNSRFPFVSNLNLCLLRKVLDTLKQLSITLQRSKIFKTRICTKILKDWQHLRNLIAEKRDFLKIMYNLIFRIYIIIYLYNYILNESTTTFHSISCNRWLICAIVKDINIVFEENVQL